MKRFLKKFWVAGNLILAACGGAKLDEGLFHGTWTPDADAMELLNTPHSSSQPRLVLLRDGKAEAAHLPASMVDRGDGVFSSAGRWSIRTDRTAWIILEFERADGNIWWKGEMDVVELKGRAKLAMWVDEPGGTAILFERIER